MTKKQSITPAGPATHALSNAVKTVLRPMIKLLMQHGLTYSWLAKNLKPIFVEAATSDFKIGEKPNSDSRISLLTGLDRKEIKLLRTSTTAQETVQEDTLIGAQLVSIWMTEPRYLDKNGNPSPLQRLRTTLDNPDDPSFEELFSTVTKSIKPRSFLDEWIRTGAVTIDSGDRVCINLDSFVTNKTFDEKIFFFERNIHDHLSAASENVTSSQPPHPDRSIYFLEISEDSAEELRCLSRDVGMAMLKKVNARARILQRRDARAGVQNKRVHLGFYFFSDDDDIDIR